MSLAPFWSRIRQRSSSLSYRPRTTPHLRSGSMVVSILGSSDGSSILRLTRRRRQPSRLERAEEISMKKLQPAGLNGRRGPGFPVADRLLLQAGLNKPSDPAVSPDGSLVFFRYFRSPGTTPGMTVMECQLRRRLESHRRFHASPHSMVKEWVLYQAFRPRRHRHGVLDR